jgi:hypothetical protein
MKDMSWIYQGEKGKDVKNISNQKIMQREIRAHTFSAILETFNSASTNSVF